MKLNWFSPLAPAQTDIAHYTQRVLPALSRRAEVTLWTDQRTWNRSINELAEVRRYHDEQMSWKDLNRADVTFYNIGNNPRFHGSIWQVSRQFGGVVILHDFRLHHFFDGLYRVKQRDLNSYLTVMAKYYGEEGRRDARSSYQNDARNIDFMAERYPLTDLALENAHAVLVHTTDAFDALRKNQQWTLAYAPLPFPMIDQPSDSTTRNRESKYRLVLFGYIGRNRRLSSVLKALAGLEAKGRFHLDVFGSILNDERDLRNQISSLNLKPHVTLHGFTAEADLDAALSCCDLAINLRNPTMGEASGSQLRIWAHGCASLVSRVGWYASLPEDAVSFVRTDENEIADLQQHLRAFLVAPGRFAEMGARGRRELEDKHSPDAYATALLKTAEESLNFRTQAACLKLAERAAVGAARWLSPKQAQDSYLRVAAEVLGWSKRS